MSQINYYNKNEEQLYILHFPGTGINGHEYIIENNLKRKINISNNLSIISIMDKTCWEASPVRKQCEFNNISLYNPALNCTSWNNTLKINYILKCLEVIDTEYVLIVDGRDVIFVNNLDDTLIDKYKTFGVPIVYNGTPVAYPKKYVESLQEIINIKGKQKYLNAGVCLGTKKALTEFYTKASKINKEHSSNKSEQYIIRLTRKLYPELATHDSENKIFRIVHQYDTTITEVNGKNIII